MRLRLLLLLILQTLSVAAIAEPSSGTRHFEHGRFGPVTMLVPSGKPIAVVLFLSDASGWDARSQRVAEAMAAKDMLVAEVDTPHYVTELQRKSQGCNYIAADLEDLGHRVGREAQLPDYLVPAVAGAGLGATLAEVGLVQSPSGTFAAALGLDSVDAADLGRAPLCAGPRDLLHYKAGGQGVYQFARGFGGSDGFIDLGGDRAPDAPALLLAAYAKPRATGNAEPAARALPEPGDLPLTIIPVPGPAPRLALMLSGDGGWAGIDKELGAQLAARGIPVIGVNSLKYFWQPRTPEEAAQDIARVLRKYLEAWKATRVILVGYSLGADALPFVVNRLPPDLRDRIASVNFLALGQKASFEIHVTGWIGSSSADGRVIAPELARISDLRRLCFYGAGDTESAASCTLFSGPLAQARAVGQGHHFGSRYGEIADRIVEFAGH